MDPPQVAVTVTVTHLGRGREILPDVVHPKWLSLVVTQLGRGRESPLMCPLQVAITSSDPTWLWQREPLDEFSPKGIHLCSDRLGQGREAMDATQSPTRSVGLTTTRKCNEIVLSGPRPRVDDTHENAVSEQKWIAVWYNTKTRKPLPTHNMATNFHVSTTGS
jgi:hypothetical protein